MRIVVCVKHVPDEASEPRLENGHLVRGEDDTLNELDEHAIEAALSLTEDFGGEVIALTMGPEDSEDAVVRALQIGADRGVVISDDRLAGSDIPATARTLAAAIRQLGAEEPVDLVLTGLASFDGSSSALAPALAADLGWPLLDAATTLEVTPGPPATFTATRVADGWEDTLQTSGPTVVSVTDQINEPRYPSFKDIRAARSKPVDFLELDSFEDLDADKAKPALVMVSASPVERTAGRIIHDAGDGGTQLAQYLNELGVGEK